MICHGATRAAHDLRQENARENADPRFPLRLAACGLTALGSRHTSVCAALQPGAAAPPFTVEAAQGGKTFTLFDARRRR